MIHPIACATSFRGVVSRDWNNRRIVKMLIDAKQLPSLGGFTPAARSPGRPADANSSRVRHDLFKLPRPDAVLREMLDNLIRPDKLKIRHHPARVPLPRRSLSSLETSYSTAACETTTLAMPSAHGSPPCGSPAPISSSPWTAAVGGKPPHCRSFPAGLRISPARFKSRPRCGRLGRCARRRGRVARGCGWRSG